MAHWNTIQIAHDIMSIADLANIIMKVHDHEEGGDVDTQHLVFEIDESENVIRLCGFDVDNDITDPADCDCEYAELKAGEDSVGGLNCNEPNVAIAFVKIRQLLEDQGFVVVPTLDPYF